MIDGLAPHARLPVWIARRVCHHARAPLGTDGHVLSTARGQTVVTCKATVRCLKQPVQLTQLVPVISSERRGRVNPSTAADYQRAESETRTLHLPSLQQAAVQPVP